MKVRNRKRRSVSINVEQMEGRLLMSAAPQFTIKDLGQVQVSDSGGPINTYGQIVGTIWTPNTDPNIEYYEAFLSGPNGTEPFAIIGTSGSEGGWDVNDYGNIVGDNNMGAFKYQNGVFSQLPDLGHWAMASSINNSNVIVGSAWTPNSSYSHAAIWNPDGSVHDIGALGIDPKSNWSMASDINSNGVIVGSSWYGDGRQNHAFYYDGFMRDLGNLSGGYSSGATAINSSGQVAGWSSTSASFSPRAFISAPNGGTLTKLPLTTEAEGSWATGINDFGDTVGYLYIGNGGFYMPGINDPHHGFIFHDGETTDLNSLIPSNSNLTVTDALGINNSDQIVANAVDSSGQYHVILLTPVPPAPTVPTITWSTPADIAYGTPISSVQLNATADVPGTFTYSVAQGTVLHAGAAQSIVATFTPTDTNLYTTATATDSINVLPAPLTVTANNATRIYGQPTPTLTGTITGLANGDTDVATYSTTSTTYSPTGTYPITPSLTDSNYNITFVNGTLTQAPVRLFVESYYLARYPNVATMVARGMYSSAFQYFRTIGVYAGDMATPDWTPAIEQTYLTANPDVARSVLSGTLRSGYEHFFLYGQYENRPGAPPLT